MAFYRQGRKWAAKWIWEYGDGKEKNVYCCFRNTLPLDAGFGKVFLYITADTDYRLFVNGRLTGTGPLHSQPCYQYYDTYDITEQLNEGLNSIAVEVRHTGIFEDTRGGLLLECTESGKTILGTGPGWKVMRAAAWLRDAKPVTTNRNTGYQEFYDSRLEPEGWKLAPFDDSNWAYATVVSGKYTDTPPGVLPWIALLPRDIPFMKTEAVLPVEVTDIEECLDLVDNHTFTNISDQMSMDAMKPLKYSTVTDWANLLKDGEDWVIVRNSIMHLEDGGFDGVYDPCILLDFGRVITGYIELTLEGMAGGMVDIGYAERLVDGRFISSVGATKFADRYIMRDGFQQFRTFCWQGFRYVKLKFRDCFKPVRLYPVRSITTLYPFNYTGSFKCSDELLEKIWEISRYTIQICSNEYIVDTPWREQGQWLGDVSAVTLGGIYAAFGDTKLPSKFLKQAGGTMLPVGILSNYTTETTHDWQSVIPDYSLWWIQALWKHYMQTGDADLIHRFYPQVIRTVQFFESFREAEGLVSNFPMWAFIDWADVGRRGESAAINGIYYGTLVYVRKIAEFRNDAYIASFCEDAMNSICKAFNSRFWNDEAGVYMDEFIDGVQGKKVSEHTNALAILYGLSDPVRTALVIDRLYAGKKIKYIEAQPFFTAFVLQALKAAGRIDLSLDMIRERWNRMLSRGATSTWEEWGINGSWRNGGKLFTRWRTLSHAWSAGPLEFLSKNLTGLLIEEPGFRKIRLSPVSGGLKNYSIAYPTPFGSIRVDYDGSNFSIHVPPDIEVVS